MNSQKRKHVRKEIDLTGLIKEVSKLDPAKDLKIHNISFGGASAKLPNFNPKVGDLFALLIGYQEETAHPILTMAEVRWVGSDHLCGLRFLNLDAFSEARLKSILEKAGT